MIILREENINEMARVGSFNDDGSISKLGNYDVRIYPENLGNASFHLIYKNEWEYVLELDTFRVLEIKKNGLNLNKYDYLPKDINKILKKFLNQKNELGVLNWKNLIYTWNINNPKYEQPLNLQITI